MKQRIKRWIFSLLGKDPEGVVVTFLSGDPALAKAMEEEVRRLEPARRHFSVAPGESYREIRKRLRSYRIGLAAILHASPEADDARCRALRHAAFRLAPTKLLAYNGRLERHHLSLTSPIASWLFLRGVPLDRIFLKPWWLCPSFLRNQNERTVRPPGHRVIEGRPPKPQRRPRIAVLTPYFPYPLSHGGAVRMFNLLREVAREFDLDLYAFTEGEIQEDDLRPVLDLAARVYLVRKPRYREPRWSTLAPPEVEEYRSPEMAALLRKRDAGLLQVEYTYLAPYGGDILVEHDVTFDLYAQVRARRPGLSAWWDWWRWRRFERRAVSNFRRVVVMSDKDRELLAIPQARVIENGVDLGRFEPQPEHPGRRVLFIGSFRHFPNIVAFRFLTEEILPLLSDVLSDVMPEVELTVVAGPEPWLHWRNYTGTLPPAENPRIRMHEFVADVRPLYHEANVVVVPTLESAGTNVKVLEAMAMERAVVSTGSGCAGFGLRHGETVWIADTASAFATGIRTLLDDDNLRRRIAGAARAYIERRFDWRAIGLRQRELLRDLLGDPVRVRPAEEADLPAIAAIQSAASKAAHWEPESYLDHDCLVASCVEAGTEKCVAGFLATRQTAPGEYEILNIAVDPAYRQRGIGRRLLETALATARGVWFLEVRESNTPAIKLYIALGFTPAGRREMYYRDPAEAAIVMKIVS